MTDYTPMLSEGIKLLATVAASFGAVKASLNGARKDISEIKQTIIRIDAKVDTHGEQLAVLKDRSQRRRAEDVPA